MRVDLGRKSMDIEPRDINYILSAYARMYLFQSRNEDPDVITFPMYESIPHPYKAGQTIPIQYVPVVDPMAVEIVTDGANIPEATPESEAAADEQEKIYDETVEQLNTVEEGLKEVSEAESEIPEVEEDDELLADSQQPAVFNIGTDQPTPERLAKAKQPPGGALPPGTVSDYGGARDPRDRRQIMRDLMSDIQTQGEPRGEPDQDDIS